MFARDYDTKGMMLIRLKFPIGVVNATSESFNIPAQDMAGNKDFQKNWEPETGVFCLVPDALHIPF